ncbi:MAG: prepilin-type N-terminal cleavage/methylation domain-containing protein [bacterium]|nr:prepilin-type N-terminal cleavage/methylation domain-containing protein [bacterium]
MSKNAFTLIELLIVVAIIGILAAIAVPNFMNAQIRAKVARSYADMKSTVSAVEQLKIDKGVMLVDFWDDDTDWGKERMAKIFANVGNVGEANRRQIHVLMPLTSPVAYLSSIPTDPFAPKSSENVSGGHSERYGIWGNNTYLYVDWDLQDTGCGCGGFTGGANAVQDLKKGDYMMFAFGPAAQKNYSATDGAVRRWVPYDASNGLTSDGDIMMKNGSVFSGK